MRPKKPGLRTEVRGLTTSPSVDTQSSVLRPQSSALSPQSSERGSTLVISLIILILLMLLGVTAMTTSDTQYKLSGNLQFEDTAMNSGETAISAAEIWIAGSTAGVSNYKNAGFTYAASCGASHPISHLYALKTDVTPAIPCLASSGSDPLTMAWDDGNSFAISGNTNQRYIIELMSTNSRLAGSDQTSGGRPSSGCNKVNTYLITARGASARGATRFIQSYYSVLSC